MLNILLYIILKFLIIIINLLLLICILTLLERTTLSSMQRRKGPNVIGFFGILQPIADGLKLLLKETIIPKNSSKFIFILAPICTFILSLISWVCIPLGQYVIVLSNPSLGILYILVVLSLNVYNLIMAGWASNSKYAFLGALRSAAQMISYELSLSFIILTILTTVQSLNPYIIVKNQVYCWFCFPYCTLLVLYLIIMLAESNRHPFDLPEAESELVSGYNIEYSSMTFALFFLAEYSYMLLLSALGVILFFGGWLAPSFLNFLNLPDFFWFGLKLTFFLTIYLQARAVLPRYRYDQLMKLGWKVFLPLTFSLYVFNIIILIFI